MIKADQRLQAEALFRSELESAGIKVESRIFKTTEDPIVAIKDLLVSKLVQTTYL